jgi:ferredoxin
MDDDKVYIGDVSKKAEISSSTPTPPNGTVEIQLGEVVVAYSVGSGESILDTLLDAGQDSPFSCKSGICMSCMAIVEEGCVVQDEAAALSDEDIAERKALMCQSRPASKKVRIHFTD